MTQNRNRETKHNLSKNAEHIIEKKLILENFTFVDSTYIIKKNQIWEDLEKVLAHKQEKLDNINLFK